MGFGWVVVVIYRGFGVGFFFVFEAVFSFFAWTWGFGDGSVYCCTLMDLNIENGNEYVSIIIFSLRSKIK